VEEDLSPVARSIVEDILGDKRWADLKIEKQNEIVSDLKSRLEKFCSEVSHEQPDCPYVIDKVAVLTGHPVDQIVRFAKKTGADLIVMGSHGRGGLADVTLGSTSRRVLRRCSQPVLIVRLPEETRD
jgi:nucleotide-binding universal stress UspA family protein